MMKDVSSTYMEEDKIVDQGFSHIYTHSVTMAEKMWGIFGMPQIAPREQHHSNA